MNQGFTWRVAIVEDHLLQRRRTEELVNAQPGLDVVWSGETLPAFVTWLRHCPTVDRPRLLILDLMVERAPSADPEIVRALIRAGVRIMVLSAFASPKLVRDLLAAGVDVFVGKRDEESRIVEAAWAAISGREWITPELASVMATDLNRPPLSGQEERVVVLYASGLTIDSVAEALNIRVATAKKYLARAKAKYSAAGRDARTKMSLRERAEEDGLMESPPR